MEVEHFIRNGRCVERKHRGPALIFTRAKLTVGHLAKQRCVLTSSQLSTLDNMAVSWESKRKAKLATYSQTERLVVVPFSAFTDRHRTMCG